MKINIPFEGFYESCITQMIEDCLDQIIEDYDIPQDSDISQEFWNNFRLTEDMMKIICKEYVELYRDYLLNEYNLDITLTFKKLYSPKYYNYETDTITAVISTEDVQKLFKQTDMSKLDEVIKKRHTSRSGFVSFYSNDLKEWLKKPVTEWDCIQLETLLLAFAPIPDPYDLWEDARCNGFFDNLIYSNLNEECLKQ